MPNMAVIKLGEDELYKLLVAGKATPDDQVFAARWIKTLSGFLTDEQYKRVRDGYEADDK